MANVAVTRSESWLGPALAVVLGVTALRIALMAFNRTDLFVDEAQYWLWGQSLEWGYYSKPPLIGWVIRLSTDLAGSDAPFFVRLPAPLLHAAMALILGWIAAQRFGGQAAIWIAGLYVTMPAVSVGSYMISTDTVMFPFLGVALGLWLTALDRHGAGAPALGWAAAAGAATGLGFLAKYAAFYFPLVAALGALFVKRGRPGWRAGGAALIAFFVVISPNLIWNATNGGATVQHTLDNADWVRDPGTRAGLNVNTFAAFFFAQFAVFGPILFAALLWLGLRGGAGDPERRLLLWYSLPILATVCIQAFLSEAYANWAVAAYIAGILAVVPWLLTKPRIWLWATAALHGALALAIPLLTAFGTSLRAGPDNALILERYLGRSEMSRQILALAADEGGAVVANDRDVLADLFYTGHGSEIEIWAAPRAGRPPNHYVQRHAFDGSGTGPILYVSRRPPPPACDAGDPVATFAPADGAYRERPQSAWRVPRDCLMP